MLDPLTAFSVAGTVVQFVDFSCKILSHAYEIYESTSGSTSVNNELEQATSTLSEQLVKLSRPLNVDGISGCLTADEARLEVLCRDCNNVGIELLQKLRKLKGKGKRKAWESFSKAIQAAWNKNEIDALVQRLRDFKDALELHIMIGLRQSMDLIGFQQSDRFDRLETKTQQILTALFEQHGSVKELSRQMITIAQMLNRTEVVVREQQKESRKGQVRFIDALLEIRDNWLPFPTSHPDQTLGYLNTVRTREGNTIKNVEARILSRLCFLTKDDRKETVALAHQRTFRWIFEEEISVSKPWSSFIRWLRDEGEIYWIAGKPGSGKSTLMKFIYQDPRTLTELQKWAGKTPLLTSSFFFWNSGTKDQRSQAGFLRALLHDVLQQEPALISVCFPSLWAEEYSYRSDPFGDPTGDDVLPKLSLEKLTAAFELLLAQKVLPVKICLFIDGLDEFEGDKIELVKLIAKCSASSSVKICASSRPLLVFEDHFRTSPQLLLQDLTAVDIKTYVMSTLKENPRFEHLFLSEAVAAIDLINEVVNVADGVFLWVRLATKSLLDGMSNHDTILDLRKRLKQIPTELVGLYEHMLNGIDPFYRVQSSEIFQIVRTAEHRYVFNDIDSPLTASELSLAIEDCEYSRVQRDGETKQGINATLQMGIIADHVKSRCAGLLEIKEEEEELEEKEKEEQPKDPLEYSPERLPTGPTVRYIHWTAREYLESRVVLEHHRERTQGTLFNPNISYLRALVLSLATPGWNWGEGMWQRIFTIMWHAYEADNANDTRYIDLMDDLNNYVTKSFELHYFGTNVENRKTMKGAASIIQDHWTLYEPARTQEDDISFENEGDSKPDFLGFAVRFGLSSYVKKKLGRGKKILKNKLGQPLLGYAVFPYSVDRRYRVSPEVIAVLFQCGADPNETYKGHSYWEYLLENTTSLPKPTDREVTLKCIAIFELFLQYGAYPNQRIGINGEKRTALAIVTETFMEWAPLDAANLHQMLVTRGATLESTLIQRQSDMIGEAATYSTAAMKMGLFTGMFAIRRGTETIDDYLDTAHRKMRRSKRLLGRGWRSLRGFMVQETVEPGNEDQSKDLSKPADPVGVSFRNNSLKSASPFDLDDLDETEEQTNTQSTELVRQDCLTTKASIPWANMPFIYYGAKIALLCWPMLSTGPFMMGIHHSSMRDVRSVVVLRGTFRKCDEKLVPVKLLNTELEDVEQQVIHIGKGLESRL